MSIETFTLIHVVISLAGITSGIIVMYGFLTDQRLDRWTAVFLLTTALTSVTGFLFPFTALTPTIKLGTFSLVVLTLAIVTRYFLHLAWRKTYVIAICTGLYFNVFGSPEIWRGRADAMNGYFDHGARFVPKRQITFFQSFASDLAIH